jgi:hypothetical protein
MGLSNPMLSSWPCSAFLLERQLEARERVQLPFPLRQTNSDRSI